MLLSILIAVFFILCISPVFQDSNLNVVSAQTDVQILSHNGFLDPLDKHYYVCGEVLNTGTQTLIYTEVSAEFFDQGGSRIAGYSHFASLQNLSPNTKAPFKIEVTSTDQAARVSTYGVSVLGYQPTDAFPKKLEVSAVTGEQDANDVNMIVEGQIWNSADSPATYVRVIATYYDSSGNVVYTDFDSIGAMDSHATHHFEIDFYGTRMPSTSDWLKATSSSVTAESFEYSGNLVTDIPFQGQIPEMPPLSAPIILVALLVSTLFAKKLINKRK
jgi:hypothetical protein